MTPKLEKRLVILSGPSGVGKGPIVEWTKKLCSKKFGQVKVRKTQTIRHTGKEEDLGFNLHTGKYINIDCRGVEQRLYLDEVYSNLENNDTVLIETYHSAIDEIKKNFETGVDFASVFISPVSQEEITQIRVEEGKKLSEILPEIMLNSLLERARKEGKIFTKKLYAELETRANDATIELQNSYKYRQTISNSCYESDDRWKLPVLIGEPRRVVTCLKNIIFTGYATFEKRENRLNLY